jgi:hypothetical protein
MKFNCANGAAAEAQGMNHQDAKAPREAPRTNIQAPEKFQVSKVEDKVKWHKMIRLRS